jgi:hypothetical protein
MRKKRHVAVHFRVKAETLAQVMVLSDRQKRLRSEVLREALQVGLRKLEAATAEPDRAAQITLGDPDAELASA